MPTKPGSESIRIRNLSRVLALLHRRGPLARAELTRLTGFNRSTVGALTTELARLGLAYETEAPAAGRAGRPSPLVHPNERVAVLAVHPDVDAVTVGLVGLGGTVHRRVRCNAASPSVPETVDITKTVVGSMASALAAMDRVVGIGAAVPGLVDSSDGSVRLAPHLGWKNEPLAAVLSSALSLPAWAGNDATLGTLAESTFGAGVGQDNVVYLNGSASGIGGGAVVGGVPLSGADGFAGELGHTLVRTGGLPCHCGRRGCLETEVNLAGLLEVLGLQTADLDQLEAAMRTQDSPELRETAARQLDLLGEALVNFVNIFNPRTVLLGGFLGVLWAFDPQRLQNIVAQGAISGLGGSVAIRRAALGADLLLVGAAELAFAPLLAKPAPSVPGLAETR
ncbi:ROK family transcriptional regulator [Arthrobacter sp. Sa2BUA2]|uniref:ROK family transcriptional regulator n=1 Tax=Arthrobacter pullicola TaxID=2762224 RepID=A0ABR8YGH4_9MICC|nr:ROK family transcriptional regulator [Arthrobacter pullicola]MBD8043326.1 ROK family transcriptional regulator [Arthrobacter pullicola]